MSSNSNQLNSDQMRQQALQQRQQLQQQEQQRQQQLQQQGQLGTTVFISHSHRDKDIVRKISHDLSEHGVHAWLDEDMIAPGEIWADKLTGAITSSDAIIIVLSNSTNQSKWQTTEIAYALAAQQHDYSKKIIPVLVDREAEIPFFLRDRLYCDLSSEKAYADNFQQLLTALQRPSQAPDQKRIEEATIQTIKAESELLHKEMEFQSKRRTMWLTTLIASMASVATAALSLIPAFFKTVDWAFVVGFVSGIVGSLTAALVFLLISRKARRKEVGHARQ